MTANLVRNDITAPGTTSVWVDQSVYTSPARNQVALDLTAFKVDENQVESALSVVTFDPKTVTTFTTTNTTDGWYKYYFIILDDWLIGTTYNKYDLVWSTAQSKFYEYTNATPSSGNAVTNLTYWSPVTSPSLKLKNIGTTSAPGNIRGYQIISKVVSFLTSICFLKAVAAKSKEDCDCDGDCGCGGKTAKLAGRIEDLLTTMEFDEVRGLYIEGERDARLAQKYCDDCGCNER
jgi:hypothetical protein